MANNTEISTHIPTLLVETTQFYNSTNVILSTNTNVSNINDVTQITTDNNFIKIHQYQYEKAFSILIFILILFLITICIYWLTKFKLHEPSLDAHRPVFIIASYLLILPWLFMDSISALYLYCHKQDRSSTKAAEQWTYADGTLPIIFSLNADYALHFLFWLAFWCFVQLKMFKACMLRYNHEYKKHMENFEWKDSLGLVNVQRISYFVQFQRLWRNKKLLLILQFSIACILMCIQITIRLPSKNDPLSAIHEQIVIWLFVVLQIGVMCCVGYFIRGVYDENYFQLQSKQLLTISSIAVLVWLIAIIISAAAGTNINYFFYTSGSLLFWSVLLTMFCYFETQWVLNQIHAESQTEIGCVSTTNLTLSEILKNKEGFETMMRFLLHENGCGNLLCYVELSQFITRWTPQEMQTYENPNTQYAYSTPRLPKYSNSNYDPMGHINDMQDVIDVFPYIENTESYNETSHYEYIMKKYVLDNATVPINISDEVRQSAKQQSPGHEPEFLLMRIYQLRAEIWSLLQECFGKFRATQEYIKLTKIITLESISLSKKNTTKNKHQRVDTFEEAVELQSNLQNKHKYTDASEDEEKMEQLPLKSVAVDDEYDEKADELRYVEERKDIKQWLTYVGFAQYYENFIDGGYESLDMIRQIRQWEQLKDIGIHKTSDSVHIMLQIKRLNENNEIDEMNIGKQIKQNSDQKNDMEYNDGWNENEQESDATND